jgi:hypothetical protein
MTPIVKLHFDAISAYYGETAAKRSEVLYIEHISKGLVILDSIGALEHSKCAFCIHPMFQSDQALQSYFDFGLEYEIATLYQIPAMSVVYAMEYRRIANSYLSKNRPEERISCAINVVNEMLIADKVQNYTDFQRYHLGKHERSAELDTYFKNWLAVLGISTEYYEYLKTLI